MEHIVFGILFGFVVLVSFYCHAAVVTEEPPECASVMGQCDFPDDEQYGEDPTTMNAEQLKTVCKQFQTFTECGFTWLNRCFPGGISVPQDLVAKVNSLFDVCDSPDLHAKGQILLPCVKRLSDLNETGSSPVIASLDACQDSFTASAGVSVQNYMINQMLPQYGNKTAIRSHFCCAGIKFNECATAAITGTCSAEAIAIGRQVASGIFQKLECPEQLLTSDACDAAGVESPLLR